MGLWGIMWAGRVQVWKVCLDGGGYSQKRAIEQCEYGLQMLCHPDPKSESAQYVLQDFMPTRTGPLLPFSAVLAS